MRAWCFAVLLVLPSVSGCDKTCKTSPVLFEFENRTTSSVHIFNGFQAQESGIDNSECMKLVGSFLQGPNSTRRDSREALVCDGDSDTFNVGISAGPPGGVCEKHVSVEPLKLGKAMLITAVWDGQLTVTVDNDRNFTPY